MSDPSKPLRVLQILLTELNEGGVERGVGTEPRNGSARLESYFISKGGRLVKDIEEEGGYHLSLDVCSKNPFSVSLFSDSLALSKKLKQIQPSIIHVLVAELCLDLQVCKQTAQDSICNNCSWYQSPQCLQQDHG